MEKYLSLFHRFHGLGHATLHISNPSDSDRHAKSVHLHRGGTSWPEARSPAHDAFARLLTKKPPDTEALWTEAKTLVKPEEGGLLVHEDTTLDKPYARKMEQVIRY